jgi:hypothetical protein
VHLVLHPVPCLHLVHLGHRKVRHQRGKQIVRRPRCRPSPSWWWFGPWKPSPISG